MPLRSESQRRWMWANDPAMARRWEAETPRGAVLPEKVNQSIKKQHKMAQAIRERK